MSAAASRRRTRPARAGAAHVLGAEPVGDGVRFRVWAPAASRVELVIESPAPVVHALAPEPGGYFAASIPGVGAGCRYRYRLDGSGPFPDPCSRFQPEGPHGPSMVVDPHAFEWTDRAWPGIGMKGQVIYELHVGTFTREGTFDAAARELEHLRALGVTMIELMPVAEFPGRCNWGYDAVALYAPFHGYGDEHALRRFVDAAHAAGLAVILDVVYNHVGPDGNYLPRFSPDYFTDRYPNEWGDAVNFDGPRAGPVREHVVRNAACWIAEFHLDGLRVDATQSMHDASHPHVLAEITTAARAAAAGRGIVLIAENEPQDARCLAAPEAGGYGFDAVWSDDFHHSARVALTGRRDGYFRDHLGAAQEFVSAARHGFLFQGQYYGWQSKPRGTPALEQPAWSTVVFVQNHDQVANTLDGRRLHTLAGAGRLRAIVALTLLGPQTPMLFMGEEFAARQPFPFFADHCADLRPSIHAGRREFLRQFAHYATPAAQACIPDPCAAATFERARLDLAERSARPEVYALYSDLLRLRRSDPVIAAQAREALDGAVLAPHVFVLRFFAPGRGDRLLAVNLGADWAPPAAPEPLLAPPRGMRWRLVWSSEHPRYGGLGALNPCGDEGWRLPSDSAALLRAEPTGANPA
jgi:maltooligosyltrehalose trehalohydrolase